MKKEEENAQENNSQVLHQSNQQEQHQQQQQYHQSGLNEPPLPMVQEQQMHYEEPRNETNLNNHLKELEDCGQEGTVHNMEEPHDIVAIRHDMEFD